jgi:hypothetical protein
MMNNKSDVADSFKDSLFKDPLTDLTKELSEVSLDKLIADSTLREIPVIGSLLNLYKVSTGIRELFTIKKIIRFLFQQKGVSVEEKEKFLQKLSDNRGYSDNVFEKLLILLERLDDIEKSKVVGNLFKALVKNKISKEDFFKLCFVVDNSFIDEIRSFCYPDIILSLNRSDIWDFYQQSPKFRSSRVNESHFASFGLMEGKIKVSDTRKRAIGGDLEYYLDYSITDIGRKLINYGYSAEDVTDFFSQYDLEDFA